MSIRQSVLPALILACVCATPARAVDWITDGDIGTFCQQFLVRPESPSGTVCLSYIQGFLDGLRTTEAPARNELAYHLDDESPEEAARISTARLNALVEEYGPPARAGICLPKAFTAEQVARVVARELRHGEGYATGSLDDYAQAALRDRYPCDISDPARDRGEDDGKATDNTEGSAQ